MLRLFRLPFAAAIVLVLGAAVAEFWPLVIVGAVVAGLIYVFGRDPQRRLQSYPLGIVSPIDGRVDEVGPVRDPFLERDALAIRVRQSAFATALMCSPTEGRVEQIWGGPEMPDHDAGCRLAIHLRTDEGDDVIFALSRPYVPIGPLLWRVQPGERVGQGQRRGLLGWGRCASVYVPANSRSAVQSGGHVRAGTDLLCRLFHAI